MQLGWTQFRNCLLPTADCLLTFYAVVPASARNPSRACLWRWLASTKLANSGCGWSGFDLNSGWNCTAMNHGWPGSSTISTNLPSGDLPEIARPLSVRICSYGS